MRYGSIYKITCLINDKIYIGQTVQNPPIKRWLDHYDEMNRTNNQLLLYRALRRWGIENFTFQILEENIELSKLNEKEITEEVNNWLLLARDRSVAIKPSNLDNKTRKSKCAL